jgi:hypothetical protein
LNPSLSRQINRFSIAVWAAALQPFRFPFREWFVVEIKFLGIHTLLVIPGEQRRKPL